MRGASREGRGDPNDTVLPWRGSRGPHPGACPLHCRFKAKLWLCEDHPLSLCEQVAPIIDLMAISNALFAKLRDFITLRLPPGFPVKIGMGDGTGRGPLPVRWGTQPASLLALCFVILLFLIRAEIPIFHILNARITFGNLNGCDEPVSSLRNSPSSEAPSPSSDSSSVSSSSSLSTWGGEGMRWVGGTQALVAQPHLSPCSVLPGV